MGASDLLPFSVGRVSVEGTILDFGAAVLHPRRDPTGEILVVEEEVVPGLPIHVFAPTRAELEDEIPADLRFLYRMYVACDESELAPDSLALRRAFLAGVRITVAEHAVVSVD